MKRKVLAMAVLASMFTMTGCILLTPPPYINQTMIIEKDANGKVIASKYERSVRGFSNHDPGTVINAWAYADNLARMSAGGDYKKTVEEKGKVGVIINQNTYETYSVEIISEVTGQVVSVALMTPNSTMVSWVPMFGQYLDVWKKDGRIVARGKFNVREDKIVSYSNYKGLYWFSAGPRY